MAIGSTQPFRPAGTVSLAAGTGSASVALAGGGETVVVTNTTAALAFVRFGADPSVTASPADMPVLPGARVMLAANSLITYAAAVLASGSGSVLFTVGDGSFI
ncbi:MAG TPA: hypothetical protein VNE67_10485 [Acetobacteraceae bacterium]|nr:hypothetical protein [Acetobacteraceae bacterium]